MKDTTGMRELEIAARHYINKATDEQVKELAVLAMTMHLAYRRNMSPTARDALHEVLRHMGPEYLIALRAMNLLAQPLIRANRYRYG